jgi:hypothetical protein
LFEHLIDLMFADDDRTDAAEVRAQSPYEDALLILVRHAACKGFKTDAVAVRNSAESRQRIGVRALPSAWLAWRLLIERMFSLLPKNLVVKRVKLLIHHPKAPC